MAPRLGSIIEECTIRRFDNIFKRERLIRCTCNKRVEFIDITLRMLPVMESYCLGTNNRVKVAIAVRQRGQLIFFHCRKLFVSIIKQV